MMSRHHFSCRDFSSWYCTFEQLSTDVMTSTQVLCALILLVVMSRHQSSGRDISFCCYRLHWSFLMSRLQLFCRDITLLDFCSFLNCSFFASCHELHQFTFNFPDVVTSELNCVGLKTASTAQPVAFISALLLIAFLSTYCCIFLLSSSFPANDKLVSFFLILYINYSILIENQTEKWTKKR